VYVVPHVNVPVIVADNRPLSLAPPVPVTFASILPKFAGVTLHCIVALALAKVRLPSIVSVQLGESVPSTLVPLVVLKVLLPVNVPDLSRFPFHTSSDRKLKLIETPIIAVTGKAYWDVGHAPKDQSNRRSHLPGYAAWEIHPVMKLIVL
jgi:hypothetical protein